MPKRKKQSLSKADAAVLQWYELERTASRISENQNLSVHDYNRITAAGLSVIIAQLEEIRRRQ